MVTRTASKIFWFFLLFHTLSFAQEDFFCFVPPKNWNLAPLKDISRSVRIGFVADLKKAFVPSINLALERTHLPLEKYIEEVKNLYQLKRENQVTNMGILKTNSGDAKLLQIEVNNHWGKLIALQSILIKNETAYIMTGTSLKEDFPYFYKDFLSTFASLTLAKTPFDLIEDANQKELLRTYHGDLSEKILAQKDALKSKELEKSYKDWLKKNFNYLGSAFPQLMVMWIQNE